MAIGHPSIVSVKIPSLIFDVVGGSRVDARHLDTVPRGYFPMVLSCSSIRALQLAGRPQGGLEGVRSNLLPPSSVRFARGLVRPGHLGTYTVSAGCCRVIFLSL